MRNLIVLSLALLAMACNTPSDDSQTKKATTETAVKIFTPEELDNSLSQNVNKEISVKGLVVHTCKHGGRKLHLVGEDPDNKTIVYATEAVGKFKKELEGSDVILTAKVIEERIDKAYLDSWSDELERNHEGDEKTESHHHQEEKIAKLRDEIKTNGKGYISEYKLEATNLRVLEDE